MFGSANHQPMSYDATAEYAAELQVAYRYQVANSAVLTAMTPSNGVSEQQSWAAAMWMEVRFETGF